MRARPQGEPGTVAKDICQLGKSRALSIKILVMQRKESRTYFQQQDKAGKKSLVAL